MISRVSKCATFAGCQQSADKAYLSEKNLRHAESLGAKPYIPFKANTEVDPILWTRIGNVASAVRAIHIE